MVKAIQLQGKTKRTVLLYPGEDGYWVTEVPSLPARKSIILPRD
jgi:hypothetical protein